MTRWRWRFGVLLSCVVLLGTGKPGPAGAQDDPAQAPPATAPAADADPADMQPEAALWGEDELDDLVAPVALYPDALLAQVLVATTFPLEVVKAGRWVEANQSLAGDARSEAAQAEGWDVSVTVLAAGFPTLIERMADQIEWTESLGDALLDQSDGVMDAIQRQRARASAVGNLESNEAQTVTIENEAISIAPADPEVVYVPTYDPAVAYTQPPPAAQAPAAPAVAAAPVDPGYSGTAMLATGVISFGAGMLVNEIFDDDDDWDDYWRGPPRFDWDDGDFYPRPGRPNVAVGGDVNINVDRDGVDVDRGGAWRSDRDRRTAAGDRRAVRSQGSGPAAGGDREAVRNKIAARSAGGSAGLARTTDGGARAVRQQGARPAAFSRQNDGLSSARKADRRGAASLQASRGGDGGRLQQARERAPTKIAKPKTRTKAVRSTGRAQTVFTKQEGGRQAAAAKARGSRHAGKLKRR